MRVTIFPKATGKHEGGVLRAARKTAAMKLMGRLAATLMLCAAPASSAISAAGAGTGLAVADQAGPYPRMAPVAAYMMDRAAEIALAKSAAPEAIAKDATVLVLTRTGYETAIAGTNGFVCMVDRGFSGAPDWPERWNAKIRAPECLNPQAARSVSPLARLRTAMTLAGRSDAEILTRIRAALRSGEIPPLEAGAMCYMMSKSAYLQDEGDHAMAHVMFFVPFRDGAAWGANLPGSPVMGGNYWFFTPDHAADAATLAPLSVLIVGVSNWSDGTPAGMHGM